MSTSPLPISRRTAIAWMMKAAAAGAVMPQLAFGRTLGASASPTKGYGADPDLLRAYRPGEIWPLTLTPVQRVAATALCDEIIPADGDFPAASAVGVVDFIDEWISAPYEDQRADQQQIVPGLSWIDDESRRRFGMTFAQANVYARTEICDAICSVARAPAGMADAARFFARFRDLTAGGYYSSPTGFKDLGYVGNVPLASFDGPPDDVLRKAGLL